MGERRGRLGKILVEKEPYSLMALSMVQGENFLVLSESFAGGKEGIEQIYILEGEKADGW